jgi:hypothetical protein
MSFAEDPPLGNAMHITTQENGILKNCEGKGAFGCLVSLLLLGVMLMIAQRVGPPYFAYKSLESDVGTEISRAGAHFFSDEVLIQNILDIARKNEIQLKRENIRVERYATQLKVQISYNVPIDLYFTERLVEFKINATSFVGTL